MNRIPILNTENSSLILPTAYCGPAEYFALLAQWPREVCLIESMETYPKQTWRNRCTILTSQGLLNLSIPTKKPNGNHTVVQEVEIDNDSRWYQAHWRALTAAYNASPFFMYYQDELAPFYDGSYTGLLDFNMGLTTLLIKLLGIKVRLELTGTFTIPTSEDDFRYRLSPKKPPLYNHFPPYIQVFSETQKFQPNLSILDVLFNLGPDSGSYLRSIGTAT